MLVTKFEAAIFGASRRSIKLANILKIHGIQYLLIVCLEIHSYSGRTSTLLPTVDSDELLTEVPKRSATISISLATQCDTDDELEDNGVSSPVLELPPVEEEDERYQKHYNGTFLVFPTYTVKPLYKGHLATSKCPYSGVSISHLIHKTYRKIVIWV